MRMLVLAVLTIFTALGFAPPGAHAYEAPWSNLDFLRDQTWSQINNRLANQNLKTLRDSIDRKAEKPDPKKEERKPTPDSKKKAPSRAVLDLGERASTNLAPLRPYLAETRLTEEQAAKVLAMYGQAAALLDVPANDSASGIAAFLAGSYAAYTNKPFPDALYKPLYEQFAESLTSDDALERRPLTQRVEYYQRLVVVGMLFQLLQLEMQRNPQPDQISAMRKAAGSAFQEIAGVSPESIRFTADGLSIR